MNLFKPPKDPALHALWVIRNWTHTPLGNQTSALDVVRKVHELSADVFAAAMKSATDDEVEVPEKLT